MSVEPGHKDHYGNELAVMLVNIRDVEPNPVLSAYQPRVPHTFFKNKIHKYISGKNEKRWNDCTVSNNIDGRCPSLDSSPLSLRATSRRKNFQQ